MSHFTVVVLVPQDKVSEPGHPDFAGELEAVVENMLAPFSEHEEVPPYQKPCSCGKWAASSKATKLAQEETGLDIDTLRSEWWGKTEAEREQSSWEDHIKPYTDVLDKHTETFMAEAKPEEDCEECHGTGFYSSTYNPLSQWDWYSLGGRWDGDFEERGIPTVIRNVAFARDLHSAAYAPFAILSPKEPHQTQHHDNWNEKGSMGWWGIVANENDNWPAIASEIFNKYSACFAVLMDLHI